ncbi:replication factor C subunit 1-like, partial [Sceloporus undulatus]|uniref:replication factor C subunit 1-like n=1 Tax=Sceloporus undulatus TaxID=8520 RepID=UPI001C4CAA1F
QCQCSVTVLSDVLHAHSLQVERQLHEDEEFARTLAMLDEIPKKKKPRKDTEEKQTVSTTKTSPDETQKNKQVHKVKHTISTLESRPSSTMEQIHLDSTRTLTLHPESSVSKERNDLETKMLASKTSSKLSALKQKAESIKIENGTRKGESTSKESMIPKGKTISPKEEKTPRKVSPQKSK